MQHYLREKKEDCSGTIEHIHKLVNKRLERWNMPTITLSECKKIYKKLQFMYMREFDINYKINKVDPEDGSFAHDIVRYVCDKGFALDDDAHTVISDEQVTNLMENGGSF